MSATNYQCPNCGAAVVFQSSITVFAVCGFCRTMVVRHDMNLENLGVMAELPPDSSLLQIGTQGFFDGLGFGIIGRVRLEWEQGVWTEWCALFTDGRYGWIAEAQGTYMVSFEYPDQAGLPALGDLAPETELKIGKAQFAVADIKETVCVGSEGELPFPAPSGRRGSSVDLRDASGRFGCLEYSEKETRFYSGRYAQFDELRLSGLRTLPGWSGGQSAEPEASRNAGALSCPNCGSTVTLRAVGLSLAAVCGSCSSVIDVTDPNLRIISRFNDKKVVVPILPIGVRGKLFGVEYEVIGYVRRIESGFGWEEFLLFNPAEGFRWLVTYDGHWSFVKTLTETVKTGGEAVFFRGGEFKLFSRGHAKVTYVLGEFYWKVTIGETVATEDYVSPPFVLSKEYYPGLQEVTWSLGEYVEPSVIEEAFGKKDQLRPRNGVYLNQPNPQQRQFGALWALAGTFFLALFFIQLVTGARGTNQQVYRGSFIHKKAAQDKTEITPEFKIEGGRQALEVTTQAGVDNSWIDFNISLVNAETKEEISFGQEVGYYFGHDSDGFWSEGRQSTTTLVPGVAPGTYYLTIDTEADPQLESMGYTVTVVRGVVIWSNFWIGAILLACYPLYASIRRGAFERQRWSESDFSPYAQSED